MADPATGLLARIDDTLTEWCDKHHIDGASINNWVDTIELNSTELGITHTWTAPAATTPPTAAMTTAATGGDEHTRALVNEMLDNPWHPGWHPTAEAVSKLTGPWLHPHTGCDIDPHNVATNAAALFFECVDRNNPEQPRQHHPDLNPVFNDIGVIAAPLCASGVICELLEAGHDETVAAAVAVTASICEFAIHEAMELFQHHRGTPMYDPHERRWFDTVTFRIADSSITLRPNG